MKVLKEITDWAVPNHTYFLNDSKDKMYAYIKASGTAVEEFKKPIKFSAGHRKFKEVANTYGYVKPEAEVVLGTEYRVPGSANNVYTVREHLGSWTCTCPASKWSKGECKHVQKIKPSAQ
jgi:hypothetical protein